MTTSTIDLTDPDVFADDRHHEAFARLRAEDPVHWHESGDGQGFWALTRYQEVSAAYLDHTAFSSESGPMLGGSFRSDADPSAGLMLVATDPPRQRMIRQQVHQAFAQDVVKRVARQVTALVDTAVDKALAAGGCDFATDVATELPAGALMVMMGLTHRQAHELIDLTRRMIGFRDPHFADQAEDERLRLAVVQAEIFEFFAEILRDRRRTPGDDLVSILLSARMNGRPWTEDEILYNCMNVAVGGNETSSYTAATGVRTFIEHPEQYRLLQSAPELLDGAVNELLRWSSTNAYVQRGALREVELCGRVIRRGDTVTLWNVSANRDEAQFTAPGVFDITRTPNRHLSYGAGIHRCIGAMLAHTELRIMFAKLATERIALEPTGPVTRLRSNFIQGITSLPVAMTRAR